MKKKEVAVIILYYLIGILFLFIAITRFHGSDSLIAGFCGVINFIEGTIRWIQLIKNKKD